MTERKDYLDVAKLFAVLSVVYVHSSITYNPVRRTIAAFFMPIFFLIYGIAASGRTIDSRSELWEFILKKGKALLVPYVLWACVYAGSGNINLTFVKGVVFGSNSSLGRAGSSPVLWFLPCMFVTTLLFQLYVNIRSKIDSGRGRIAFALSVMMLCGFVSLLFDGVSSGGRFFGSDIAFSGCLLMIVGRGVGQKFADYLEKRASYVKILVMAALFMFTYIVATLNLPYVERWGWHGVVMALGIYGRYDLFLGGAIAGSAGLLLIAMLFHKVKLFACMGRFSLVIMAVHNLLFTFVKPLCNGIADLQYGEYLYPTAVTIVCFVLCIPLCFLINWAVPELNGKFVPMEGYLTGKVRMEENKNHL